MLPSFYRTSAALLLCCAVVACSDSPVSPDAARSASWSTVPGTEHTSSHPAVIFVVSQGLFFNTCTVEQRLPMQGDFQLLINARTILGPGQPGFLNGRWWEDHNGNGVQDQNDHFFFCPLLLPGRLTP